MGLTADQVTACLVTRGDIDLAPILDSLIFDRVIVWDNSTRADNKTAGRYKACALAETDVVYFQGDDNIVSPEAQHALLELYEDGVYLSNMAAEHNRETFSELTWAEWGALARRDLPPAAFKRWKKAGHDLRDDWFLLVGCDIVFSILTPTRRVDLGQNHLPYAWAAGRVHRLPGFHEAKCRIYEAARELR